MNSKTRADSSLPNILLSAYAWTAMAVLTIFWNMGAMIFLMPLSLVFQSKRDGWMHRVAVLWAKSIIAIFPFWSLKVEGLENIERNKTYMIVANHQSLLDIMVALKGLPLSFKFLAKRELFSIPFLGWHMRAAGYIPLERGSSQSGKAAMLKAGEWLHRGVSMLFFPEGTRSEDGRMRSFKGGAFKIALEESVPILPVVIDGTAQAIPKKSRVLERCSPFHLSIGKPVQLKDEGLLQDQMSDIQREMERRLNERRRAGWL